MNYYPYRHGNRQHMMPMQICPHMHGHTQWRPMPQPYAMSQNWPNQQVMPTIQDHGKEPFIVNIHELTKQNNNFRTTIWTGEHLQVTLMKLNTGEDIGLEMHPHTDQFLRIEQGEGVVQMGNSQHELTIEKYVADDSAIMVPAGSWHNLTNVGPRPLKLYSIYAPAEHGYGALHVTKADAIEAEQGHP